MLVRSGSAVNVKPIERLTRRLKVLNLMPNISVRQTDRQTDRHLYLVIKLRVVPSGANLGGTVKQTALV